MKRPLLLLALVSVGCATVMDPTNVPVCARHPDVTCRAPVETERSVDWERSNVCQYVNLYDSGYCACYMYAGACDGRQVYRYEFMCTP